MATKLRGSRLETEVDRARTEGNWKRVTELLPSVRAKNSGLDYQQELLEAEAELENYIEQNEVLSPRADAGSHLRHAVSLLKEVIDTRNAHPGVVLEARLLLAKVHYVCGEYSAALTAIERSGMDSANTPFRTLRALRLVAEAYAVKGLSLDAVDQQQTVSSGQLQKAQAATGGGGQSNKALYCFEKAAELAIHYVDELEKSINSSSTAPPGKASSTPTALAAGAATIASGGAMAGKQPEKMGDLLECCLERVALLRLRQGAGGGGSKEKRCNADGVEWYRRIITCLGDKSTGERLQQRMSRQLAELLLRAVPDGGEGGGGGEGAGSQAVASKSQSLGFYTGSQRGYFSPTSRMEEIVLLLLISEVLATREVVLSQSEELSSSRLQSLRSAKSVYNLLTLVLSSLRQYRLLSTIYERAMKFANQDSFLWTQFSLSLLCRGRYQRAARVLAEGVRQVGVASAGGAVLSEDERSEQLTLNLLAAQLHLEHTGQYLVGVEYAEAAAAVAASAGRSGAMHSRCQLLAAIGLWKQAGCELSGEERACLLLKAGRLLEECVHEDPHDYLACYYAGLYYASVRNLAAARERCARSLELNAEQPCAIMLLALIFTADGDLKGALELVLNALHDFPKHYGLLVLRLHIEAKFGRIDDALSTSSHLLEMWKQSAGGTESLVDDDRHQLTMSAVEASSLRDAISRNATSMTPSIGRESAAILANSLPHSSQIDMSESGVLTAGAASTCSDAGLAASTAGDSVGGASAHAWAQFNAQAVMWQELAELFLVEGRLGDVAPCVEQAVQLFPHSHHALYLKGRLLSARADKCVEEEMRGKLRAQAKAALLSALAIGPSHVQSLAHLSKLYCAEGNVKMAEQMLRELVRLDPLNCSWWDELGRSLAAQGEHERALECLQAASSLDRSTPLIPFRSIPLVFPHSFN